MARHCLPLFNVVGSKETNLTSFSTAIWHMLPSSVNRWHISGSSNCILSFPLSFIYMASHPNSIPLMFCRSCRVYCSILSICFPLSIPLGHSFCLSHAPFCDLSLLSLALPLSVVYICCQFISKALFLSSWSFLIKQDHFLDQL